MRRPSLPRGFTLIELLVVVGIIAILASLLFPVVGAMQRNAKVVGCQSNMRELAAAIQAYTTNSAENRLPPPTLAWAGSDGSADFVTGVLWPYIGPSLQARAAVMHCPADTLEQYCSYGADVIPPPYRNFSYSLNIGMSTLPPQGNTGIRLGQVHNPIAHVMVYEEFAPNDVFCYGPSDGDDWLTGRHGGGHTVEHRAAYLDSNWRQDGRGNVCYFDGHVSLMTVKEYFGSSYHFGPLNQ